MPAWLQSRAFSSPERSFRRNAFTLIASLAIGALLLWILRRGNLPVVPDARLLQHVDMKGVILFGVLWTLVLFMRSYRWVYLLEPIERVPLAHVLRVSFIALGALVVLPLRSGEVVRPALIARRSTLSPWAAAGTVAAERVIDGLFLSALLFLALTFSKTVDPLPDHIGDLRVPVAAVHSATYGALVVFACAFVAMGVFYWRRDWARRTTERVIGVVSLPLATKIADVVTRVADGLQFLPRLQYTLPLLALTAAYWCTNAYAVYVLLHAAGLASATPLHGMAVLGVLSLGVLAPNAPGLFGTFQVSVYAALALFFPPTVVTTQGAAFVFLLYIQHVGITLLGGAIALVLDRRAAA